jgi:hypothetical protein
MQPKREAITNPNHMIVNDDVKHRLSPQFEFFIEIPSIWNDGKPASGSASSPEGSAYASERTMEYLANKS